MDSLLKSLQIKQDSSFDDESADAYRSYLQIRTEFLVRRFERYPDFPGIHTGYDSITGEEFRQEDHLSYSWINGRGVCTCCRLARHFPKWEEPLAAYAQHTIGAMISHFEQNQGHFPFVVNLDGTPGAPGPPVPPDCASYSDLYACFGFLEYGVFADDVTSISLAKKILQYSLEAIGQNRFVTEPDPTPGDRIPENPMSVAVDLLNEFARQLDDHAYLDTAASLIEILLDRYHLPDSGPFVEYVTPKGEPFEDDKGRWIVDSGHSIEFCSFCLGFSRLAEKRGTFPDLRKRIDDVCPSLLLWNIENGWNKRFPGFFKWIDGKTRRPVDDSMPWWSCPECLLALLLVHKRTGREVYRRWYREVNNGYFSMYMNRSTSLGPFQCLDGKTGMPTPVVPACKFQDPEFHSGKNLLTCIEILGRARQ